MVSGDDIGLVGTCIRDLLSGKTVDIFGSGEREKHLLYVSDLVEVVLEVGSQSFSGFEAYNLSGEGVEMSRLLGTLVRLIDQGDFRIRPFPKSVQQLDVGEARVSDEALVNWIGALPVTPLEGALQHTVDYFRRRLL
jgi:dTDP-D-glucose 4,6-dehydratase